MTGLYHSAKGTTWNNHKYTNKITKNGKTRYVYEEKINEGRAVAKSEIASQMRKDLDELGLPESVINKVIDYTSSIEDFYAYMEAENIQTVDQLKTVLKKAVKNSGAKYMEASDVDKLFDIAEKVSNGDKLTKNDYLDIAEISTKTNAKDLTKIGDSIKNETRKNQPTTVDKAINQMNGKPMKVVYANKPSVLPTEKATFGKKVYWKMKDGAEKVSDFTTDMKVKGIKFVRKLFG